jgi:hypothetical protein
MAFLFVALRALALLADQPQHVDPLLLGQVRCGGLGDLGPRGDDVPLEDRIRLAHADTALAGLQRHVVVEQRGERVVGKRLRLRGRLRGCELALLGGAEPAFAREGPGAAQAAVFAVQRVLARQLAAALACRSDAEPTRRRFQLLRRRRGVIGTDGLAKGSLALRIAPLELHRAGRQEPRLQRTTGRNLLDRDVRADGRVFEKGRDVVRPARALFW